MDTHPELRKGCFALITVVDVRVVPQRDAPVVDVILLHCREVKRRKLHCSAGSTIRS